MDSIQSIIAVFALCVAMNLGNRSRA